MSTLLLDICVSLFCILLSAFLYNSAGRNTCKPPQSYILKNQVTHSRLLPVNAAHAFTYPTVAFLVSLNALETHRLDLARGWVFGYGGLWGRITGLRPNSYLTRQPGSIRKKLEALLEARGCIREENALEDAWMMTMPSFLGFEGINPLTVYFCYNPKGILWSVVLEIHNTFGESHVHVLEVGRNEVLNPPLGYDHQWTFPREFHVSPFNDRSGFYTVSVKLPTHSPIATNSTEVPPPRPAVRVHLYTTAGIGSNKGQLKLTALLRPVHSIPLTTFSLLATLAKAPFTLLLSMPRILLMAWKLHYQKHLDIFIRPEPFPASTGWNASPASSKTVPRRAGGVKWLRESLFEVYARKRVIRFLRRKTREIGVEITLIAADPSIPHLAITPGQLASSRLTISYLSSRMFILLLVCPSPEHALLLGGETERLFSVSSKELFLTLFSASGSSKRTTWLQCIRSWGIPQSIALSIPVSHFLEEETLLDTVLQASLICAIHIFDFLEKSIFTVARVRIVEGQEPWKQWERAALVLRNGVHSIPSSTVGSVISNR